MKQWAVALTLLGLAGCGDGEAPTKVEVEVTTSAGNEAPFMGKNLEFYQNNAAAFATMRAWCKKYVGSVRTDAQSMECSTVGAVHRLGGPNK